MTDEDNDDEDVDDDDVDEEGRRSVSNEQW